MREEDRNTNAGLGQEPEKQERVRVSRGRDAARSRGVSRGRVGAAGREALRSSDSPARKEASINADSSAVRETPRNRRKAKKGGGISLPVILLALIIGFVGGLGTGWVRWKYERPYTVDLKAVEVPSWVEQDFIRKNIFSRPDVSLKRVNAIVIHYVANPNSSAQANRDYFDSLADQDPQAGGTSASAHFVVGLEGEVIQCIPVTEMAYAAAPRNDDTISIENCHPDDSGSFNEATYDSLVKLTASLCSQLKLTEQDVIRHYDVSGKSCPKYYVDHEDQWKQFQEDVKNAIKEKSWL